MHSSRAGVLYGVAAYGLWGFLPLYWLLLDEAGSVEVVAHRVVWSLVVVLVILAVAGRLRGLTRLGRRAHGLLAVASVVVAANWCLYIWAVDTNQVIEASLGYFVNPLVTILLGVVVLRERLRGAQWLAVGIAALAVVVLTIDYGRLPWIALALALTFATYGFVKKKAGVGAAESLAIEAAVLVVPSAGFLVWLAARGEATFGHAGPAIDVALVAVGLVTAIPLLCFSAAATRVPLTTLGQLQYLAPTINFVLGVTIFDEDVPPARLAGFGLVWIALVIVTVDALRHRRRAARIAVESMAG